MGRLLSKDGITVFSDIILQRDAKAEEVHEIMKRFHLNMMGTLDIYDNSLQAAGLKKIFMEGDGG